MKHWFFKSISCLPFAWLLLQCERDDICSDANGATPRLVVRFYNIANAARPSPVANLYVQGVGNADPIEGYRPVASADSILLPLKSFDTKTTYQLTQNYGSQANTDLLELDYQVAQQFLYRGCGFVARYRDLKADISADGNNWIKAIEVVNTNVDNELRAQIKIYY